MTAREFTVGELDAIIGDARTGTPEAADLAAFARRLLTEREAVARLHRQQVERLEDDAATLAAERDALRATVDRLRPVVEKLAEGCDHADGALHGPGRWDDNSARAFGIIGGALDAATGSESSWSATATALRALLADAAAEVPDVG